MYHREEIINGVLCYKTTPNGEWIEYTKEQLTAKIEAERIKQSFAEVVKQPDSDYEFSLHGHWKGDNY